MFLRVGLRLSRFPIEKYDSSGVSRTDWSSEFMLFSQNTIEMLVVRAAGCVPVVRVARAEKGPAVTDDALDHLRVLYCSNLDPDYYGEYRLRALKRLPLEHVATLDAGAFAGRGLAAKLQFRLQAGPGVQRLNHAILEAAQRERANVLLADKVLGLWPATLRQLNRRGVVSIDYMNDNPFGPRHDPGWRMFRRAIPRYDLHAVPRQSSVADFLQHGAREAVEIRFTYEPSVHFAPPVTWSDRDRDRNASFIGTPYDERGPFLARLWRAGIPLDISGSRPHWEAALPEDAFAANFRMGELKGAAYRDAIWRSRINLAFVTHSNCDQVAHKSFEITACGGFLLAERTPEHQACFEEDVEAVFFSGWDECRAKIERYLYDEPARAAIAHAGHQRALHSGYDNDTMLRRLLTRAAEIRASRVP